MNARPKRPSRSLQRRRHDAPDARVLFFRDFLRRPLQVGSIIPSSRFLERRIVHRSELAGVKTVVELGPGTGGTTRAVLAAMDGDARLLVIEINPRFASLIRRSIDDPRLVVEVASAADLAELLTRNDLPAPEVVLSGIPFSTMPRAIGLGILRAVHDVLAPGGRFVAYQVRDRVEMLGRMVFGVPEVQTELRNVPPMRVWRWDKPGATEHAPAEA